MFHRNDLLNAAGRALAVALCAGTAHAQEVTPTPHQAVPPTLRS